MAGPRIPRPLEHPNGRGRGADVGRGFGLEVGMICPLLLAGIFASPRAAVGFERTTPDCKEEGCAWWNENLKQCAVLVRAVDMDKAVLIINALINFGATILKSE